MGGAACACMHARTHAANSQPGMQPFRLNKAIMSSSTHRHTPQLRALLFIAIGAAAIIYNKHRNGKPHFRTLHGKARGARACCLEDM